MVIIQNYMHLHGPRYNIMVKRNLSDVEYLGQVWADIHSGPALKVI